MKTKMVILIMIFWLFSSSLLTAQGVDLLWHTFLGSASPAGNERGYAITRDSSGYIYVSGSSEGTWGSPVNAHSGNLDSFVVCLDNSGNLVWNTFLGSVSVDGAYGIALDSSGHIYVSGLSSGTWGSPISAHSGGYDVFIACMDSSGNLLWNTFLGSSNEDQGEGITLDGSGNVYVTGMSDASWGTPVNTHSGNKDAFVACLNSSGSLLWNTFLGSYDIDWGCALDLDSSGNILVIGYSKTSWGSPIWSWATGGYDAFVACLNSSGNLLWHTFLGGGNHDLGFGIVVGNSGQIFVAGWSDAEAQWLGIELPLNAHSGDSDSFVACLDGSGNRLWYTFLGSGNHDFGYGVNLDNSGNIVVTGRSEASWGSPVHAHSGGSFDVFVAGLDNSGNLLWNTFFGSTYDVYSGNSIALDSAGHIYLTGTSWATWGLPINPYNSAADVLIAKLFIQPWPKIVANGSDGPISITQSDTLQIRVSLNRFGSDENVDYWLAYKGPSGWVHYNNTTKKWETGLGVTHQGALMDLNSKKVFQSKLSPGNYTFYFGVDMNMDGKVTKSSLYKDEVKVTVTQ